MSSKPTADAYIRVSRRAGREGESFISPEVQRKKITAWAKLHEVEILEWWAVSLFLLLGSRSPKGPSGSGFNLFVMTLFATGPAIWPRSYTPAAARASEPAAHSTKTISATGNSRRRS